MKYLVLCSILLASPVYAIVSPAIPVDGNGNPVNVIVDAAGNVLPDSGYRIVSGTVTTVPTDTRVVVSDNNGNTVKIYSDGYLVTTDAIHSRILDGTYFGYDITSPVINTGSSYTVMIDG